MNLTAIEELQYRSNQGDLLHRITNRIRQSLELQEILTTTVAEVRSFLQTDRVKVYRFHPDGHGEVTAESIYENRLPSLLGLHFPADDISLSARELFLRARLRCIVDLESQQIGLSHLNNPETGELLDIEDIRYRPVDPCHVKYLRAMGVKSSLVVPILHDGHVWGLLVSHHSQPRALPEADLQVLQLVADQVAVAIAQSTLLSQAREHAQREATVNRISALLHALPTIQLQEALEEVVEVLQASGGRIFLLAEPPHCLATLYSCGEQPKIPGSEDCDVIEQHSVWKACFQPKVFSYGSVNWQVITDHYQEPSLKPLAPAFQNTQIRGLLVVPLQYRQQFLGYLTLFRNQIDTETLWAGQFNPDERQLHPRRSFTAWRELRESQTREWTPEEIELAHTLGGHFSMAVEQYELYQQVHRLNDSLEGQVEERTIELQQAAEQQQALFKVITKIRESLDLETIFQATVREVRKLLNADRVAVFQFTPDLSWSDGRFIAEDSLPNFVSVLGIEIYDHCFAEQYAADYSKGRVQAIANIYEADLSDCHIQFLAQFQIKANLIVPLIRGKQLWGFLCIHQCTGTRHWQTSEVEFVIQIANQLGVAIQQAELLAQTQLQAEQLTLAFHDLQKTQSQLVQTEKMSSLGQLVAGVAHEINNPVNFIYGNLNYAASYAKNLLDVIAVYQRQYPDPTPQIQAAYEAADVDYLIKDFPKILTSMRVGADRIRQIVQSLKNFSRLDEAAKKPVNIHEGIDSTLLILQHRLKASRNRLGIEVLKEYGDLPLVECYAGQLNQVFMNILNNAIVALEEAMGRGKWAVGGPKISLPTIRIRTALVPTEEGGDRILIRIADNGCGITESVRSRLFDPFFTTKPVGQGVGLGLSISYQIVVEHHGGTLHCTSRRGGGAEFWIEIPSIRLGKA